jgi:hypothetical protein
MWRRSSNVGGARRGSCGAPNTYEASRCQEIKFGLSRLPSSRRLVESGNRARSTLDGEPVAKGIFTK